MIQNQGWWVAGESLQLSNKPVKPVPKVLNEFETEFEMEVWEPKYSKFHLTFSQVTRALFVLDVDYCRHCHSVTLCYLICAGSDCMPYRVEQRDDLSVTRWYYFLTWKEIQFRCAVDNYLANCQLTFHQPLGGHQGHTWNKSWYGEGLSGDILGSLNYRKPEQQTLFPSVPVFFAEPFFLFIYPSNLTSNSVFTN